MQSSATALATPASSIKRKRDFASFPYSDQRSQRITASLSSRFSKSLKMDMGDLTQQQEQQHIRSSFPGSGSPEVNSQDSFDDDQDEYQSQIDAAYNNATPSLNGSQQFNSILSRSPNRHQNTYLSQRKIAMSRSRSLKRTPTYSSNQSNLANGNDTSLSDSMDSMDEDGGFSRTQGAQFTFENKRDGGYIQYPNGDCDALGDLSPVMERLERESVEKGLSLPNLQTEWQAKRKELEHNLTLLQNGIPSDSYDDLKTITEKIMEAARWLSGGNTDELRVSCY
jgi:hypothetical protein